MTETMLLTVAVTRILPAPQQPIHLFFWDPAFMRANKSCSYCVCVERAVEEDTGHRPETTESLCGKWDSAQGKGQEADGGAGAESGLEVEEPRIAEVAAQAPSISPPVTREMPGA